MTDAFNESALRLVCQKLLKRDAWHVDLKGPDNAITKLIANTLAHSYNVNGFDAAMAVIPEAFVPLEMKRWVTFVIAACNLFGRLCVAMDVPHDEFTTITHLNFAPKNINSVYGFGMNIGSMYGSAQKIEALCVLASFVDNPLEVNAYVNDELIQVARLLLPQHALEFLRDHSNKHSDGVMLEFHAFAQYAWLPTTKSDTPGELIPTITFQNVPNKLRVRWEEEGSLDDIIKKNWTLKHQLMIRRVPNVLFSPEMVGANAKQTLAFCRLWRYIVIHIPLVIDAARINCIWKRNASNQVVGVDASRIPDIPKLDADEGRDALIGIINDKLECFARFYADAPPGISFMSKVNRLFEGRVDMQDLMSLKATTCDEHPSPIVPCTRVKKRLRLTGVSQLNATIGSGQPFMYRPKRPNTS